MYSGPTRKGFRKIQWLLNVTMRRSGLDRRALYPGSIWFLLRKNIQTQSAVAVDWKTVEANIMLTQKEKCTLRYSLLSFLHDLDVLSCPVLLLAKTGRRSILYIPQPNIMRNSMRLLLTDLINTDNLSPLTGARPFLVMTVYSIHGNKTDNSAKLEAQLAYWRVLYRWHKIIKGGLGGL